MSHDRHDGRHDGGLAADLPALLGRRNLLALLGGAGGLGLAGAPARALAACVALPWETAGPYPADGTNSREGQVINVLTQSGVLRDDIRSSFGNMTGTAEGVPLVLDLTLLNADGCTPLAGHAIYLWHCTADGYYSLYTVPDQNFLRGVAVSDAGGKVRFQTIVPGCYDGRWPHIHFEIYKNAEAAVSGEAAVLTAQTAMPEAEMAALYKADSRYAASIENLAEITIPGDNVFGDNSAEQIAQQTLALSGDASAGYVGTLAIPVDFTAERRAPAMPPGAPPDGNPPPGPPPAGSPLNG